MLLHRNEICRAIDVNATGGNILSTNNKYRVQKIYRTVQTVSKSKMKHKKTIYGARE